MSKIAIIQFPGSNCETESLRAVREAGMEAEEFLWNRSANDLAAYDGYFIVGGFSYEDRSRSGIVAALDPLMPLLKSENDKGKPILGVCNGAQILVESGLVPGLKNDAVGMALAVNKRLLHGKVLGTGFYNAWVTMMLSVPPEATAFSRNLKPGQRLKVPVAHGEGRFVIPETLLQEMIGNNQTVFRYCDEQGNPDSNFPINPNGATYNLAAVTNVNGTAMAMMPHPERSQDGQAIFTSWRDYIAEHKKISLENKPVWTTKQKTPLQFSPSFPSPAAYQPPAESTELLVQLIIADKEAATVENTLRQLGYDVHVERLTHWEITGANEDMKQKIINSGELFNPSKEKLISEPVAPLRLLVRYREEYVGQQKKETLVSRYELSEKITIKRGTLWLISGNNDTITKAADAMLQTHIFYNPFSQDYFLYH